MADMYRAEQGRRLFEQTPEDIEADRELREEQAWKLNRPMLAYPGESEVFAVGRVSGRLRKAKTRTGWVLIFQTAQMFPEPGTEGGFKARQVEEWRVYGDKAIARVVKIVVPGMMVAVQGWRRTVVKYTSTKVRVNTNLNVAMHIDVLDISPDYNAAIRKELALYDGSKCDERRI